MCRMYRNSRRVGDLHHHTNWDQNDHDQHVAHQMEEYKSDHHHGNKKTPSKPASNSRPHSEQVNVHGQGSRRISEGQRSADKNSVRTSEQRSGENNVHNRTAKTASVRSRNLSLGEKHDRYKSSEEEDFFEENLPRAKKYATWDRNYKKRHAKLERQQQRRVSDDLGVGGVKKGRESSERYQKLSRSISTDLATLRSKTRILQSITSYSNDKDVPSSSYTRIPSSQQETTDQSNQRSHVNSQSAGISQYQEDIPKVYNSSMSPEEMEAYKKLHNKEIKNSKGKVDTYIDIDSLLKHDGQETETEDEDFNFPTLEGYRRHGLKHSFPSASYSRIKHLSDKSLCAAFCGMFTFFICAFLMFFPLAALFVVIFPVCFLLKKMCSCCCCYGNKCECGKLLSKKERRMITDISNDAVVFQGLLTIEYGLSTFRIRELIKSRLVMAEDKSGNRLYPKFTQKVAETCSGPCWVKDNEFFINNHVFSMPSSIFSTEDLQEHISEMSSRPLSLDHPLWEVQMLTDFGDQRDTVLLLRIHPCVSDGLSIVQLLYKSIVDMEAITIAVPKFSSRRRCLNAIQAFLCGPLVFLSRYIFKRQDFNLLHGDHVHAAGKRVIAWSEPYTMEAASRITQVTRSTLNDVLLSVAAGCLRNYLQANGIPNPYDMNSMIPIHFHTGSSPFQLQNNDCLFITVPIPTNTEGVIPRLWQTKHTMDKIGNMALFSVTQGALWLSSCVLPDRLYRYLWNSLQNKCTCIISNLPGPETTLRISAKQVKSIMCWMPPVQRVAIAITFFTYDNTLRMSVMTDRAVLPNPELLTKDFVFFMDSLSELLANRRIPGEQVNKKYEIAQLDCEIHAEPTIEQLQVRMSIIQQELQDLKTQLDSEGRHKHSGTEAKLRHKIDQLKEQFRELLVEMRQRKAAEAESAIILTDEDQDIEDDEDNDLRRPFRRRTLSIGSRMSTASASSTVRPLAASPSVAMDMYPDDDSWSQASTRTDGIASVSGRPSYRRIHQPVNEFEILEYSHSPSMERRFRTY